MMTALCKAAVGAAILFTTTGTSLPALVAEDKPKDIVRTFSMQVKMGGMQDFIKGFKAYNECYVENGGTGTWTAWRPESGDLSRVGFRTKISNWADYDDQNDGAGEECGSIFRDEIVPHVKSMSSGFTRHWHKVSAEADGEIKVVKVIAFDFDRIDKAYKMTEAFHEGLQAAGRDGYSWWITESKNSRWDASIALLEADWAGMAFEGDPFWTIQEKHHGKEKAQKLRKEWEDNVKDVAINFYTRIDDASNMGK